MNWEQLIGEKVYVVRENEKEYIIIPDGDGENDGDIYFYNKENKSLKAIPILDLVGSSVWNKIMSSPVIYGEDEDETDYEEMQ